MDQSYFITALYKNDTINPFVIEGTLNQFLKNFRFLFNHVYKYDKHMNSNPNTIEKLIKSLNMLSDNINDSSKDVTYHISTDYEIELAKARGSFKSLIEDK